MPLAEEEEGEYVGPEVGGAVYLHAPLVELLTALILAKHLFEYVNPSQPDKINILSNMSMDKLSTIHLSSVGNLTADWVIF